MKQSHGHGNEQGTSVLGLLLSFTGIFFFAFFAVPVLVEARKSANTDAAMNSIKAIRSAIASQGGTPSLEELANGLQIDKPLGNTSKESPYRGYYFSLRYDENSKPIINATRFRSDSGKKDFVVKESGDLCSGPENSEPRVLTGNEPGLKCINPGTFQ